MKRQFHEQGATLQTLQTTLAEENAAQRYNLQALTKESDQERHNTEIAVQDRDEQHEAIVQLLMAHIAHYEEKEQKRPDERDAQRKEWVEWQLPEERHSEVAAYPQPL